jgi:nucleoside-diphosphate-sugar epimerase
MVFNGQTINRSLTLSSYLKNGTPKKQLDVSLLNKLDWKYKISLNEGIKAVYSNYLQ